jgi:demethylmenaquinone methyltransferase/2-methoxy-6-polyprenyl-1,4-benzoquinol methylase
MTRHPIPERNAVAAMFDRIARRYDFLNRLLSFGTDIRWRRRLVSLLPDKASRVLDVATGTADVLLAALKQNRTTQGFGADVSVGMMEVGLRKIAAQGFADRTFLFHADARALPFVANAFSAVTVAFGVRNFADLEGGLQEIYRVLAPGGRGIILEFSLPDSRIFRRIYLVYLRHVLPALGTWLSGDPTAYRYLNATIETFPYGEDFLRYLRAAGFRNCRRIPLTLGIATVYIGEK